MLPSSSHSSSKANSAVTPTTDSIQRHKKPFLKMYKCDLWVFYNSVYSWPFFTLLTAGNVLTSYKGFPVMYRLNRFCMIKLCYCCKNTCLQFLLQNQPRSSQVCELGPCGVCCCQASAVQKQPPCIHGITGWAVWPCWIYVQKQQLSLHRVPPLRAVRT